MSSDVQAKWMNSAALPSAAPVRALMKYSTALTSWLVSASIALISVQSSMPKCTTSWRRSACSGSASGGSSGRPSDERAISHSISTRRRSRMNANSEKTSRSSAVWRP